MKDFDALTESELADWARARIEADTETMVSMMREAGVVVIGSIGYRVVDFNLGIVLLMHPKTKTLYTPGPTTTLIAQTRDGEEHLWREGDLVYAMDNPAA